MVRCVRLSGPARACGETRAMAQTSDRWPNSTNLAYVEGLYEQYLRDPDSVDEHWREQFASWTGPTGATPIGSHFERRSVFNPADAIGQTDASAPPSNGRRGGNGHGGALSETEYRARRDAVRPFCASWCDVGQ